MGLKDLRAGDIFISFDCVYVRRGLGKVLDVEVLIRQLEQ